MAVVMGVYLLLLTLILPLFDHTFAENVPVVMWGKGTDSSDFPSVSALSVISRESFDTEFLQELTSQKNPLVVVFIQDELSLETFSVLGREETEDGESTVFKHLDAALSTRPFLYLSVEDPVDAIRSWAGQYRTKEVRPDDKPDTVAIAAKQADILMINLPDTGTAVNKREALRSNDVIMGAIAKTIGKERNDGVFLYTGIKPAWEQESVDRHLVSRHLLASVNDDNCTIINMAGGRMFLCTNNITFTYTNLETKEFNATTWTPHQVTTDGSTTGNTSSMIVLKFPPNEWVTSLVLNMEFNQSAGSWSMISTTTDFSMKPEGSEVSGQINMSTPDIGAAQGFSYSCSHITLLGKINNDSVAVTFDFFQVQTFGLVNERFSDSFDCSTFFTVPIWMGLFVVILFTTILAVGIYMLFEVHTMDRFDDPKGKPLVITTAD